MSQQVTSQARGCPACHGNTDSPFIPLPSDLRRPGRSKLDGTSIDERDLWTKSLRAECLGRRPAFLLQCGPWVTEESTWSAQEAHCHAGSPATRLWDTYGSCMKQQFMLFVLICTMSGQAGQLILKVNFQNAFNYIRRDKLLQSVLAEVPGLYHLVYTVYSNPSFLFFGSHIIDSAEGVQQGDPLGPLLFSITVHHLLGSLRSEFKIFYLDDGTLGGGGGVTSMMCQKT